MPRQDITEIIAGSLHSLPHPDGRPRRLMHFSQFAHDESTRRSIQTHANDIAESIQHLLEQRGYTLSHRDDLKPADAEGYKNGNIFTAGGKRLATILFDDQLNAHLSRLAIRNLIAVLRGHTDE